MKPITAVQFPLVPQTLTEKPLLVAGLLFLGISGALIAGVAFGTLPVWSLILASASAAFVLWRGSGSPDLFHPVRVFGSLWCFCLTLAALKLNTVISDWGVAVWFYFIIGLVSFIAGCWVIDLHHGRYKGAVNANKQLLSSELLVPNRTLLVAIVCLIAATAACFYEYNLMGDIPALADNPNEVRGQLFGVRADPAFDTITVKLVHLAFLMARYGVVLVSVMLFQLRKKTRTQRLLASLLLGYAMLLLGSQGGRGYIYESLVTCAVLYHYIRQRLRVRGLVFVLLLGFLFISIAGYSRNSVFRNPEASLVRYSQLPRGAGWDIIATGYATVTSSFEVFYRLTVDLAGLHSRGPGYLFYGFHRLAPRQSIQEVAEKYYSGMMITPTFLAEFYADFGILGIMVGPSILGCFFGLVYYRAMKYDSIYWICALAIWIEVLSYFPYVNLFSFYYTWIWDMVAMALVLKLCRVGNARRASPSLAAVTLRVPRQAELTTRGFESPVANRIGQSLNFGAVGEW